MIISYMENSIQIDNLDSSKILPISEFFSVKKNKTITVKPSKNSTTMKRTHRKKKCPKGKRRNTKTKRCRIKCKTGFRRNKTNHRCKKMRTNTTMKKA
jgi:hypothetical protein